MSPTHSPKQMPWTPGPWAVTDNRRLNGAFWITTRHPEGWQVSLAEVRNGCDEADEIGDVEANAHLIAASPEIYDNGDFLADRLEDFQNSLEAGDVDDAIRDWHGHVVPALARFRAALSKARPTQEGA